jgi:cbb3-type cytochrome oxidase subunit 3
MEPPTDDEVAVEIIPSTSISHTTSGVMILWYCFVAVVIAPFIVCVIYFMYHNHRSHRRALQATMAQEDDNHEQDDHDVNLELIRQNVKAWSESEKKRVTRIVRLSVRKNVEVRKNGYRSSK